MRLLLVEEDDLLGSAIHKALTRLGYAVDWIVKGTDLEIATRTHDYACVLLDLGLSDESVDLLPQAIRHLGPGASVVVMTARGGTQDRIAMLDLGADDCMTKPIDLNELAARLRAVLRRARSPTRERIDIEHGPLRLFTARRMATWKGEAVPLTNKEYWLLEALLRQKHRVVSRAQLEEALYGWGEEIGSNAVEVYIHYLRRKFGANLITTVRGAGYRIGSLENAVT